MLWQRPSNYAQMTSPAMVQTMELGIPPRLLRRRPLPLDLWAVTSLDVRTCPLSPRVAATLVVAMHTVHTSAAWTLLTCVSCAHCCPCIADTNTDMDSIGSAIGAAHLFDGVACRSERALNGEIAFALEFSAFADWEGRVAVDPETGQVVKGTAAARVQAQAEAKAAATGATGGSAKFPPYFGDMADAIDAFSKQRGIVLVDHNEPGQMPAAIGSVAFPKEGSAEVSKEATKAMKAKIKGVIDHHALSDAFSTAGPIFMDLRPWGSACSIVTHMCVSLPSPCAPAHAPLPMRPAHAPLPMRPCPCTSSIARAHIHM